MRAGLRTSIAVALGIVATGVAYVACRQALLPVIDLFDVAGHPFDSIGFVLLPICVGVLVGAMIRVTLRRKFPDGAICRKYGYDLRGLPHPRCPECGTRFGKGPA